MCVCERERPALSPTRSGPSLHAGINLAVAAIARAPNRGPSLTRNRFERSPPAPVPPAAAAAAAAAAASLAPTESDSAGGSVGPAAAVAVVTLLQCSCRPPPPPGPGERTAAPPQMVCTARLGPAEYRSRPAAGPAAWDCRLDEVFVFALPAPAAESDGLAGGRIGSGGGGGGGEEASQWVHIRVFDAAASDPARAELGRARVPVPRSSAPGPVEAWYPLLDDAAAGRPPAGRILVRAARAQVRAGSGRRGHGSYHVGLDGALQPSPRRVDSDAEPGPGSPASPPVSAASGSPVVVVLGGRSGGPAVPPKRTVLAEPPVPPPPTPAGGSHGPPLLAPGAPGGTRRSPAPLYDSDEGGGDGDPAGSGWAAQLLRPPRMSSAPARPRK